MEIDRELAFFIFAMASLFLGVLGLAKGNIEIGLGESESNNIILVGAYARIFSALLIVASIFLFLGLSIGYFLLFLIVCIALILRKTV